LLNKIWLAELITPEYAVPVADEHAAAGDPVAQMNNVASVRGPVAEVLVVSNLLVTAADKNEVIVPVDVGPPVLLHEKL
jgi:hypothetical protein